MATVDLAPEIVTVLDELAAANGTTRMEELTLAVSNRKFLMDRVHAGDRVTLESDGGSELTRTLVQLR